ncbi:MAG: hypothetical protein KDK34_20135, partial [Leptospiraceae bacterium]|nr:hypothetical protein [Leptospiraceae bacterium]
MRPVITDTRVGLYHSMLDEQDSSNQKTGVRLSGFDRKAQTTHPFKTGICENQPETTRRRSSASCSGVTVAGES